MTPTIRLATPEDAPAVLEIYRPVVEHTAISFECAPPDQAEISARIREVLTRAPWLVAEQAGQCLGYAYGGRFRSRAAYAWSLEVSVYVHPDHHRRGVACSLYEALFGLTRLQGFHMLVAGATLPNPASVALHESMGFRTVGTFERTGYKFGAWHSVVFWERQLQELPPDPCQPLGLEAVMGGDQAQGILDQAAGGIRQP
jgi:L-amino acid N-acyltransferase YncA